MLAKSRNRLPTTNNSTNQISHQKGLPQPHEAQHPSMDVQRPDQEKYFLASDKPGYTPYQVTI